MDILALMSGFLTALADAHAAGRLRFFGEIAGLGRRQAFAARLAPLRRKNWFVYAKPPFAGPEAVLAYLARTRTASPLRTAGSLRSTSAA